MRCSWVEDDTPHEHIPRVCGKGAAVIYQGPRWWQVDPLCKDHAHCIDHLDPDKWQKFSPAEHEVYRVMSE